MRARTTRLTGQRVGGLLLASLFLWACGEKAERVIETEVPESILQYLPAGAQLVEGNVSCSQLGYGFGVKIDDPPFNGTFTLEEQNNVVLTGGAQDDPNNSVTVVNPSQTEPHVDDPAYFDWTATLGIDAVIVKGGDDSNAIVYDPEVFGANGLRAPINPNNGNPYGISHIEFCYDYELDIEKTAETAWTQAYGEWQIQKDFDANYSGLPGDDFLHQYKISVTGVTPDNTYVASGTVTVSNNTPINATIGSITDEIDGIGSVALDCGVTFPYLLAAGASLTCTYETEVPDDATRTNTATVEVTTNGIGGGEATADIVFDALPDATVPVTVTDDFPDGFLYVDPPEDAADLTFPGIFPTELGVPVVLEYTRNFVCPTDPELYASGPFYYEVVNTATIVETEQSDIATVTVTCGLEPPTVVKTAAGTYDRRVEWTLTKSVDPASHTGKAGEVAGSSVWLVAGTKSVYLENYAVSGQITINNPNGVALPISSVDDALNDGTIAVVTCPATSVDANGQMVCDYTASPDDATATLNTVEVEWANGAITQTVPAEAAVSFTENLIGVEEGTLKDDRFGYEELVDDDFGVSFDETFTCSDDASKYTNGEYQFTERNTAVLNGAIGLEASAEVDITCTLDPLVPSKDAAGSYDRTVTWELTKWVNETGVDLVDYGTGLAGASFPTEWLVAVDKIEVSDNYAVVGTISISNPAAIAQTVTGLTDVLNDGTEASLLCDLPIVIPAGATATCGYEAAPADDGATLNTATVSAAGNPDQNATADVVFEENLIGSDVGTLTDARFDFSQEIDADFSTTFDETFTCSELRADYGDGGFYDPELQTNTATFAAGNFSDEKSATADWACKASFVDIYKTTNGAPADPSLDIIFTLYSGQTQLETLSTLGNGADLYFQTPLVPGATYTMCENPVPAGYTFEIIVEGGNVLTYAGPPGETNPTGEIQCFDFTAKEPYGTTTFSIENSFPGGAPRTPGYWKNWTSCSTGGHQVQTAAKLGGIQEGVFLLEDLLPQTLGTWTVGDGAFPDCSEAVRILDARSLDGTNQSNDAAYTLARALLAARLNQDAGACTADGATFDLSAYGLGSALTFEQVLSAADDVLSDPLVDFDGTGDYLASRDLPKGQAGKAAKELAARALALYEIIDDYNNGLICTGDPSH